MNVFGMARFRNTNIHTAHQPTLGVIENVAVKHPASGPIVVSNNETKGLLERHINGVSPGERPYRIAFIVEHLEKETVEMNGM